MALSICSFVFLDSLEGAMNVLYCISLIVRLMALWTRFSLIVRWCYELVSVYSLDGAINLLICFNLFIRWRHASRLLTCFSLFTRCRHTRVCTHLFHWCRLADVQSSLVDPCTSLLCSQDDPCSPPDSTACTRGRQEDQGVRGDTWEARRLRWAAPLALDIVARLHSTIQQVRCSMGGGQ